MNTQTEFNVLDLRPDLGEHIVNRGAFTGSAFRPGVTGALVVLAAQALIVSVGALFCTLCGVPIGS